MDFPTSFLFIAAACVLPVLRGGGLRAAVLLAVPAVAAWQVMAIPSGVHQGVELFGLNLELMRVDRLSGLSR